MKTVVGDVRYIYDFLELSSLVQRCVEQFDKWLNDYGEIFFLVVSTTIDLHIENKRNVKKNDYYKIMAIMMVNNKFFHET